MSSCLLATLRQGQGQRQRQGGPRTTSMSSCPMRRPLLLLGEQGHEVLLLEQDHLLRVAEPAEPRQMVRRGHRRGYTHTYI